MLILSSTMNGGVPQENLVGDSCEENLSMCGVAVKETPMRFAILIDQTATGFGAHVPDLPGCVAAGTTLEETGELIREAIAFHLEGMRLNGEILPQPTSICEYVEVAMPA